MTRPSLKSRFGEQIRAFVGYKNSLGFPYNESIRILGRFDDFCVERFPEKDCLDCELALAWLEKRDTENTAGHRNRIMVIREFAKYLRAVGTEAYMIPISMTSKGPRYVPHNQTFSVAGARRGFSDPRGTLFFEIARLVEARHPAYLILENVPGLLSHSRGETYATILNTLDRLGYGVEWQCLNSKDFGVPQSRNRVYIIGYLDERCRGKVFPFTETTGSSLIQTHGGHQGERVYSPEGLSCTLAANPGGFGGKTGLYEVGVPIKCATKTGYQMAQVGDSIDLSYATVNSRRGRVGKQIAHTLTTGCRQGTLNFIDLNPDPKVTEVARCVNARVGNGIRTHRGESSGVLCEGRIRRLTPRECLRLQGWADDRIDTVLAIQSDNQAYKQAGNGVTVHVVEAIGRRIAKMDAELRGEALAP